MTIDEKKQQCQALQSKFAQYREVDPELSLKTELEYLELRTEILKSVSDEVFAVEKTFNPKTLDHIKSEPTEIVCKDFLPLIKGAYNIIAGAGGVGKSTIALRSAIHYLKFNPMDRALMIMGEDDKDEIMSRLKNIITVFFNGNDNDISFYIKRMDFITVDNPVSMRFLEKQQGSAVINKPLVDEFKDYLVGNNIKFVVLDPLKKFHSADENSNSEMDLLVRDVFLEIAGELKVVMLILHHSSKSRDGNGSRGASTISDTSRIAYRISKKYITDKESGDHVEDPDFVGKVRVSTIKDNKNIFAKYGTRNTILGMVSLYGEENKPYEVVYEMPGV